MAGKIVTRLADRAEELKVSGITITERVYLDANGRATTDEAQGNSLWATPGSEVTSDEADAVGYAVPVQEKAEKAAEPEKAKRKASNPATKG